MINKGANDWNMGFRNACCAGQIDMCKYIIEKGANDFDGGLECACKCRHIEIVELMIEKGAKNVKHCFYCCQCLYL